MEAVEIESLIKRAVPDADVEIEGADCAFSATVISPSFHGVSLLSRQRRVLSAVNDLLRSGELHAMTVMPFTPQEWTAKTSNLGLIQLSL